VRSIIKRLLANAGLYTMMMSICLSVGLSVYQSPETVTQ